MGDQCGTQMMRGSSRATASELVVAPTMGALSRSVDNARANLSIVESNIDELLSRLGGKSNGRDGQTGPAAIPPLTVRADSLVGLTQILIEKLNSVLELV